jgi:hypothetical protein
VTFQDVDTILLGVGKKMSPAKQEKLKRALQVCFDWYHDAIIFNSSVFERERLIFVQNVREAVKSLTSLLTDSRMEQYGDLAPLLDLPERLERLDRQLERVEKLRPDAKPRTGLESDFIESLIYADHFKERSPFDWLAGLYLPELYYLFFDHRLPLGKGRKFLSFVNTILRMLKIKTPQGRYYSKEAISRARRLSDQAPRRKGGPRVDTDIPDQMEWYRHMSLVQALGLGIRLKSSLELARQELAALD